MSEDKNEKGADTPQAKSLRKTTDRAEIEFFYPQSYAESEPFSKPHTVVILLLLIGFVVYAAQSLPGQDSTQNAKYGFFAAISVGLIFCAEHLRDTLFVRPHPAIWRFATGVGLFYTMFMTYLLFQDIKDARALMPILDPKVTGKELPHRDYAADCSFTYEAIKGAVLDEFVIAHLVGWIFKHMMIRDMGLSMLLSVLFELMEYSFEFIQPNFKECWWDHWLLDFALCNTGGILIGELIMRKLSTKTYDWAGIREIPTVSGKIKRAVMQFTPYNWIPYNLKLVSELKRFTFVTCLCAGVMLVELDAFFLKDIFWVQPPSKLNVYRLILWWAVGMVGLRDYYAWMTDSRIKRLGSTAWVMLAMMIMEFLVVFKFKAHLWKGSQPPTEVVICWAAGLAVLLLFVFVRFTPFWGFVSNQRSSPAVEAASSGTADAHHATAAPVIAEVESADTGASKPAQHAPPQADVPQKPEDVVTKSPPTSASSARRRRSVTRSSSNT